MSIAQFLHGVETIEIPGANQSVTINPFAVPCVTGTAPLADATVFPLNTPVLLPSTPTKALLLGETGTLLPACRDIWTEGGGAIIVIRVAPGVDINATMTNVAGDFAAMTGVYAALTARALTGVMPRTLIAPGYTSLRPGGNANPVVTAMINVAHKLRGRVYAATPSTSQTEALAWRHDFDSDRLEAIYPVVKTWNPVSSDYVTRDASAVFAGLTAEVHRTFGFWESPSNKPLRSVGGTDPVVDWQSGDPDCTANILNQNKINTIINVGAATGNNFGGWRRWGNNTCASDANWTYEVVRTISDACYEALDEATLWAVDKPPSAQLMVDMTERANAFFKQGKRDGWLVGGRCWLDPEDNTPAQMKAGVWVWRIDPEAPAPMEHIVYKAYRNANYYNDLVATIVSAVGVGTAP